MDHVLLFTTILCAAIMTGILFMTFVIGCTTAAVGFVDFLLSIKEDIDRTRRIRKIAHAYNQPR